ncbi:MAG: methyltransferase [Epsilonproteobacteria bacterium]|nr:methyltransferase [Campylobacterota bacterium]
MEFNKFAHTYNKYNIIQKKIINRYINSLESRVIDLGCGSEGLCKYKKFDFYLGIDSSEKMLNLNPCQTLKLDFNTKECFDVIKKYDFNQLVSFSALQWAKDLEFVFKEIKQLNKEYLLAIFTSNTFKTLHNYLEINSPIYSKKEIINASKILKTQNIETLHYTLTFNTPLELLKYIKYSGVRGNVKSNIAKIKNFISTFPFNYLEFEIIILNSQNNS